jgi:hypothetical protein
MAGDQVVWRKDRNYRTVREIGLRKLNTALGWNRRVIVKPRKALGYSSVREDNYGGERIGRGATTILPNQYGEITAICSEDFTGQDEEDLKVGELLWFGGGLDRKHVRVCVREENRLNDLLVVGLLRRI